MIKKRYTIITARSKSSRFPNKILENITRTHKSIDILIERSNKIKLPIILATTNLRSDDKLCRYVSKKYNIHIFRGNSKNKIKRWFDCFKRFKIKSACMVDGDDLCFDYNIYNKYKKFDTFFGYKKNVITGVFLNIIDEVSMNKIYQSTKNLVDTEMIEPFVRKSKLNIKYIYTKNTYNDKKIRLTFDYEEDRKFFKYIYNIFKITEKSEKIINYLLKNKKISNINYFRENNWKLNQRKKISKIKKIL